MKPIFTNFEVLRLYQGQDGAKDDFFVTFIVAFICTF